MPRDEQRLHYANRRKTRVFDPIPDSFLDDRDARRHQRAFADEQERLAEARRRAEEADTYRAALDDERRSRSGRR